MKDNYLWNRTGEPDPDVQELEEILGALRYQPRPLEIPAGIQVGRHRTFFPALAIAAAIALIAAGLGLWLNLNRQPAQQIGAKLPTKTDQKKIVEHESEHEPGNRLAKDSAIEPPTPPKSRKFSGAAGRNFVAENKTRRRTAAAAPQLTPEEIAE